MKRCGGFAHQARQKLENADTEFADSDSQRTHRRTGQIGTDVWRLIDGTRNIGQIARELAAQHQIEKREAEVSLQQFFKELGRRGYIGFAVESIPEAK